jgi:hypothetical protein
VGACADQVGYAGGLGFVVLLSGGGWQRLAIVRALLRDESDLLMLDEPRSGLGPEAEAEPRRQLRADRDGRTWWRPVCRAVRAALVRAPHRRLGLRADQRARAADDRAGRGGAAGLLIGRWLLGVTVERTSCSVAGSCWWPWKRVVAGEKISVVPALRGGAPRSRVTTSWCWGVAIGRGDRALLRQTGHRGGR